jgi:hypothetical protein
VKLGDKWLMDCTNDEIKAFAASFRSGYKFNDEDCAELRKPNLIDETLEEAVDDYIRAYEA